MAINESIDELWEVLNHIRSLPTITLRAMGWEADNDPETDYGDTYDFAATELRQRESEGE